MHEHSNSIPLYHIIALGVGQYSGTFKHGTCWGQHKFSCLPFTEKLSSQRFSICLDCMYRENNFWDLEQYPCREVSLFSPAYIRHVSPASLQYRFFFDMEMGRLQKALMWPHAPPKLCPSSMAWILLGEDTGFIIQCPYYRWSTIDLNFHCSIIMHTACVHKPLIGIYLEDGSTGISHLWGWFP